jgi:hypothetical protein
LILALASHGAQATSLTFTFDVNSTGYAADTINVCNVFLAQNSSDPLAALNTATIGFHTTTDSTPHTTTLVSPAGGGAWLDPQSTGNIIVDTLVFQLNSSFYSAQYGVYICGTSGREAAGSVYNLVLQTTSHDFNGSYSSNAGLTGLVSLGSGTGVTPGSPFTYDGPQSFSFPLVSTSVSNTTSVTATGSTGMLMAGYYFYEQTGTARIVGTENTTMNTYFEFDQQ